MKHEYTAGILVAIVALSTIVVTPGVVTAQSGGQVIGQPKLSLSTTAGELSPGTTDEITIAVTNRGRLDRGGPEQYETRVTTARGLTLSVEDNNVPVDLRVGQIAVGNVPTGSAETGPISVTVPADTEPGTYNIPVEYTYQFSRVASYDSSGVEYSDLTRTRTGSISITVRDEPRFEVVSTDADVQVGGSNDISVTLQNTGSVVANAASVTASSRSSELTFDANPESSTAFIGTWEPGETKNVTYSVSLGSRAALRNYTLDLSVDYTDRDGIDQTSRTLNAGVVATPEQSFTLSNIDSTLQAGRDGAIEATLTNTGEQPVENVVLNWNSSLSNISPQETQYAVGDLAAGESATVRFGVDISDSADAGPRQFSFEPSYRNSNNERVTAEVLEARSLISASQDEFELTVANSTLIAGQTRTLRLNLTNIDGRVLRNIDGQAFVDDPLSSDNSETFTDELAPGESTIIRIDMSAAAGATAKRYPVSIDFQYETPDSEVRISDTYQLGITIESESGGGGLPLLPVGAVVIVLLAGGGIWYWRRQQD